MQGWVIRKGGSGYHKLLVIANNRMVFDAKETAEAFILRYLDPKDSHYVDTIWLFGFETVLTIRDVHLRDWERFLPRRENNVQRAV